MPLRLFDIPRGAWRRSSTTARGSFPPKSTSPARAPTSPCSASTSPRCSTEPPRGSTRSRAVLHAAQRAPRGARAKGALRGAPRAKEALDALPWRESSGSNWIGSAAAAGREAPPGQALPGELVEERAMLVCFVVAKKAGNEIEQRQSEPPAWSDDLGRLIASDESLQFEGLQAVDILKRL